MLRQTDSELRAILNRLAAVAPGVSDAGRFNGAKVGLFVADVQPGRSTLLADLTPASYTGYALSAAIAWGAAFTDGEGSANLVGDTKQFPCTGAGVVQHVYGYFVQDSTGVILLWAERFAAPVDIDSVGDTVVVLPRYTLSR